MPRLAPSAGHAATILRFGPAELDTNERALLIEGRRAALGPRAYGLLKMLVDERHRAVSKQELLDTVWRGVVVEENNLQVQISTLRRLLGPNAIATIPGRGYRFMLPVEGDVAAKDAESSARTPAAHHGSKPQRQAGNLPERLPELYGREAECAAVQALIKQHPLVSIVGAAGIGKTRLALAAAHATSASWPDGVWMIELHALNDPDLLVQTMAQALKATLPGVRDPVEELVTALRGQHALLLVDNCEHLIDAVGIVVERLLRGSGGLHLLVTSQEPLHLADEQVYRLAPLSVPQEPCGRDAFSYGAVRLFFERTRALLPRFELTPENTPQVVEVCRRLDGLALAIELAAARVPVLGVSGVRERLGERFRILTGGSRVAPKRHQTLRAALDWSHALLDDEERAVYRRLGLFVGSFSLESAEELGSGGGIDPWGALEHLSSLVDRSLVIAEGEPRPRYRLLESTREHALEQLAVAGETDEWMARHAAVTRRAVERAIRERRADIVLAEMGNVRSAYDWARGANDRREMSVALATLPSMVLAVEGAVQEAKQRLLEVEPLIDDSLPSGLVAQYWQWYGRIGVDGRLPARRCVDAFRRAEGMFAALGNLRHVHACRRHGAEAMLDAGDLEGAASMLSQAEAMEGPDWPLADRMRRLRVQGLWLAKAGRTDEAVRTSMQALHMAQQGEIDRYELVLLDDIARMHLEAGHAHEAAERYRALAGMLRQAPNSGLTLSNALAGLIAALMDEGDVAGAGAVAGEALSVIEHSGIFAARADILARLAALQGRMELAARLLCASERFRVSCETLRDAVEQRCRDAALRLLNEALGAETLAAWAAMWSVDSEEALSRAVRAGGG